MRDLNAENAEALVAAATATYRTKKEIELVLAHWFPRPDIEERVVPLQPETPPAPGQLAPERVAPSPMPVAAPTLSAPTRVTPLSRGRFEVHFMSSQQGQDDLRAVQALLGHGFPRKSMGELYDRAMHEMRLRLEKKKLGASNGARRTHKAAKQGSRYIPVHVRKAVWERDGGRCTFVSKDGHRCEERGGLEFDHRNEFARGGGATVAGMRLLCRAHNQYAAE